MLRELRDEVAFPFCSGEDFKTEFGFERGAVGERSAAKRMFEVLKSSPEQKGKARLV